MFKSYRQRWKRQADVLQLQRNLLAGAAGNNGSNISIVRPDVTTVMVYDPRQGFGSSLMHPPGPYFIQGDGRDQLCAGGSIVKDLPPHACVLRFRVVAQECLRGCCRRGSNHAQWRHVSSTHATYDFTSTCRALATSWFFSLAFPERFVGLTRIQTRL
ncbi:uncharacterized protein [Physcomitrium patens]|uniref:uncharacterized protein isoform X1 n=1 Tax=Physcomitrium patens TaxID=3218 RepID=UPI003CCCE8F3